MNDTSAQTTDTAASETATKSGLNRIEDIDETLKNNKLLDELGRGYLIRRRFELYVMVRPTGKRPPKAFASDTSKKTGISVSVVRRLFRIGRLPAEVRAVLIGTKIADRQDLLVELSDKVEGKPVEEQVAAANELVANPPKYGPRMNSKTPTAKSTQEPVEALPVEGIMIFEGLPIGMTFQDNQPRIQDLELGRRLGYGRPRDVRSLVKELVVGGYMTVDELRGGAPRDRRTAKLDREHWLTEEQALFITSQSSTPIARALTRQLVRAFIAARDHIYEQRDSTALPAILDALGGIYGRLVALESGGMFGARSLLLVPQLELEDSGYSMEGMNEALIKAGYGLSKKDEALRDIAAKLKLIGDLAYGYWNTHSDRINRTLSESWRFNDEGMLLLEPRMLQFCQLKAKYEKDGEVAPREKALQDVLDGITPIGIGIYKFLTRDRKSKVRPPFPGIRGPNG